MLVRFETLQRQHRNNQFCLVKTESNDVVMWSYLQVPHAIVQRTVERIKICRIVPTLSLTYHWPKTFRFFGGQIVISTLPYFNLSFMCFLKMFKYDIGNYVNRLTTCCYARIKRKKTTTLYCSIAVYTVLQYVQNFSNIDTVLQCCSKIYTIVQDSYYFLSYLTFLLGKTQ